MSKKYFFFHDFSTTLIQKTKTELWEKTIHRSLKVNDVILKKKKKVLKNRK